MDLNIEVSKLRDLLNREQTRAAALRAKSKRLALDYEAAKDREGRAKALLDELLERQRELTCVLDRANSTLRRNEKILAQATPQITEMLQALPDRERQAWVDRLLGIQDRLADDEPAGEIEDAEDYASAPTVVVEMDEETAAPVRPLEADFELVATPEVGPFSFFDTDFALAEERCEDPSLEFDLPAPNGDEPVAEPDIFSAPVPELGFRLTPPSAVPYWLDDSFRLQPDPGDSTRLQFTLDLPESTVAEAGQYWMFDGMYLLPVLDSCFELAAPTEDITFLHLEPCLPDRLSANPELPLGSPTLADDGQPDVLKWSPVLGLDSRFAFTPPNGECGPLALDDTFRLEMPAPNGCRPMLSLPFVDASGPFRPEAYPTLDFDAIADVDADDVSGHPCPETDPEPPIPSTRSCPRCGRESDASYAACQYCYAAMDRQAAKGSGGLLDGLMRLSGRKRG